LRHYVVVLLQSSPTKLPRATIREQCVLVSDTYPPSARVVVTQVSRRALVRSNVLRATSTNSPIPFYYYQTISQDLSKAFAEGTYLKDGPPKQGETPAPPNPLSDPAAMDGMMAGMRTQMVMMVPQMIVMGWINFFFEGFVLSTFCPPDSILGLSRLMVWVWGIDSQVAVPANLGFQVHAAARDSNSRHGCPLGVVTIMVLPELLWTEWPLSHHPGWRRRWVLTCFSSLASPVLCLIWTSRGRRNTVTRRQPFRYGYATGRATSRL
jgi:hypothetical protein